MTYLHYSANFGGISTIFEYYTSNHTLSFYDYIISYIIS